MCTHESAYLGLIYSSPMYWCNVSGFLTNWLPALIFLDVLMFYNPGCGEREKRLSLVMGVGIVKYCKWIGFCFFYFL